MKWTEEDFRDAARLLAVLEQRSKNRRAGRLGPVALEIADQLLSPTDKRADGESDGVQVSLNRRPQLTSAQGEVGRGFDCGQVVVDHGKCWPAEGMAGGSITCPRPDADMIANGFTVLVSNSNAHRK